MTASLKWTCKKMNELSAAELYSLLKLRSEIFVVEQNCVYLDPDGKDENALHLCGRLPDGTPVAYARLLAPGVSYDEASIGRVAIQIAYRKYGFGKKLMLEAIEKTCQGFHTNHIRISAQQYLLRFYSELGFSIMGDAYMEDGIPHVEMLLTK